MRTYRESKNSTVKEIIRGCQSIHLLVKSVYDVVVMFDVVVFSYCLYYC